jgi:nucleoside 2-deoxyribosyltransferase
MNVAIKPIETFYQGYRFRSRLEARWAVFFDELGLKWSYEVQGFDIGGERYLPDFVLEVRGERIIFEIKPEGGAQVVQSSIPSVYFAGRMGEGNYRPFETDEDLLADPTGEITLGALVNFAGKPINYTGPFHSLNCDHGYVHGVQDFFTEESTIFERSMWGIERAQYVCALFEDAEAFGTLVEIGYAVKAGKILLVGFTNEFMKNHCDIDDEDLEHNTASQLLGERGNPLWFATVKARSVATGTREECLGQFKSTLEFLNPCSREVRVAFNLAAGLEMPAYVACGDPVSCMEEHGLFRLDSRAWRNQCLEWMFSRLASIPAAKVFHAATAARQSRFEFGQSGAR